MQSIFPLSWCTDRIAPKMQTGRAALDNMRTSPVVEIPMFNRLKRKHSSSPEPVASWQSHQSPLPHKKRRVNGDVDPARFTATPAPLPVKSEKEESVVPAHLSASCGQAGASNGSLDSSPSTDMSMHTSIPSDSMASVTVDVPATKAAEDMSVATSVGYLSPLQQVIENEFNMQILLKHNELRLIEQELAKCQVALEQLRRCELRPFPGAEGLDQSITSGTGPAIIPQPGHSRPLHGAPYGVTDGPYSQHYRHWLLHDPQFDSVPEQHFLPPMDSGVFTGLRSSRVSNVARKSVGRPAAALGRGADSHHSIPNYPAAAPKDKSAPLVLRRSTDGQLVKLVCNDCQRGNFSSIQGFLNHCRIAHKVDYKSHDAAAIDCGRLLDEHEAANLPLETQHAPPPKPAATRSTSTSTTAAPHAAPTTHKNLVHPMNLSGAAPVTKPSRPTKARPMKAKASAPAAASTQAPFKPSAQAPRLSALFAKQQVGGDLDQAIKDAKQKIEFGSEEEIAPSNTIDAASPSAHAPGARMVSGSAALACRPPSRKGHREPSAPSAVQRHRPSPLTATPARIDNSEVLESPHDHSSVNLSPHTTADSNPGLVSDHEDFDDHASVSDDDEIPQDAIALSLGMPVGVRRGCSGDDMDVDDVTMHDDPHEDGVVIRRHNLLTEEEQRRGTGEAVARKLGGQ